MCDIFSCGPPPLPHQKLEFHQEYDWSRKDSTKSQLRFSFRFRFFSFVWIFIFLTFTFWSRTGSSCAQREAANSAAGKSFPQRNIPHEERNTASQSACPCFTLVLTCLQRLPCRQASFWKATSICNQSQERRVVRRGHCWLFHT